MMHAIGIAWNVAAIFFLLSAAAAPFVVLVRKARARGKRLFRDEPLKRLRGLHPDAREDHRWDAM